MKVIESVKRHPYRTGTAAALVLGIATGEIVGYAQNPNYDVPARACISPPAVSETYVEPSTSTLFQTYTGMFTTGVVARGIVPAGAYGVQASFKSPDAGADEWEKNASDVIKGDDVGKFALKMAIGDGKVQFGVRTIAPAESPLCHEGPPVVTWQHLDRGAYFANSAPENVTIPWPNPIAVVANIF